MPTFAAFLIVLEAMSRGEKYIHPSLMNAIGFVYNPPPPVTLPSMPTQQIIIVAGSICSVSFGGR